MKYHFTSTRVAKMKIKLQITFGEDVETLESLYIASENLRWYSHYGRELDSPSKSWRVIIWPSSSSPRDILKRTETCSHKNLHIKIHSSVSNK